jgi:hypothetical protein
VLIMGFGPRRPKDLGEAAPALCPNCGNHVVFRLLEIRNWFSLFFIPLVPGRARHVVVCPICQYGIELSDQQLAVARHLITLTAEQTAGRGDPGTYRRAVDAFWSSLGGERLAAHHEADHAPAERADPTRDAPPLDPRTALAGPAAGWYPDPFDESEQRYWDGERWTAGPNPPVFER